jgi:hypothetical protein
MKVLLARESMCPRLLTLLLSKWCVFVISIVQLSFVIVTEGVENSRDAAIVDIKSMILTSFALAFLTRFRQPFPRKR